MPETLTEPIRHRIGTWGWQNNAESIRAAVFGHMVTLAMPIVDFYRSDLYHDASWLKANMHSDECTFEFAARQSGTTIGNGIEYVMQFRDESAKAWKVHFERERHFLAVVFTPIY